MVRGRPSKGANAKVVTATVKLTRTEADNLTLRHGSASLGLRHLVDTVLHQKAPDPAKPHRHVRGLESTTQYVNGTPVTTYVCAHDGCDQTLTGR